MANLVVMANWKKININTEDGKMVEAQAPYVISASRSTDIPAFYADWFFHRLKQGYSVWTNPFNGMKHYVAYDNVRFVVFWSKNPRPLLSHIDYLSQRGINCYIQYTLNDYVDEGLERGVPNIDERIDTFITLVKKLGKGRVIWRFDPLILTDKITIDNLLAKIDHIGSRLVNYTEKLVFSFADIATYKKVKSNLEKSHINYTEWTEPQMQEFAKRLALLNKKWGYQLATCGEKIDLKEFGIAHNHCVDEDLIIRLAYKDKVLMDFLGVEVKEVSPSLFGDPQIPSEAIMLTPSLYAVKKRSNRDSGQRNACGCMASKDIGEYNTCPHLCEYCYANASKEIAVKNYHQHQLNSLAESIKG